MEKYLRMEKMVLKKLLCVLMVFAITLTIPNIDGFKYGDVTGSVTALASTAKEKKKQAEEDLDEVEDQIDDLKSQQSAVSSNLSQKASELNQLLGEQDKLKNQITGKQEEIARCNENLEEAKEVLAEEYDSMKKRIQFMYENGTSTSFWTAIIEADGITDMLNRIEYVSDVYQSDRDLMTAYQESVDTVTALSEQLNQEMTELLALQEEYETKQGDLEQRIAELENEKDKYASEIAKAEDQADQYQKIIDEQAAIIQAQEAAAAAADDNYDGGGTGDGGVSDGVGYLNDPSNDPKPTTNVKGKDVVAYALQFVGNPYVWGGNSLTKGCDCSGFVHLVYKHFGISTPRYSQAFKSQGKPVAFCNRKAGDVVVYPGHVAIYIGNGCIVEAQSTKAGITAYRSIKCHTITGLRRYV